MQPATETLLLDLLPDGAAVVDGELTLGGIGASELAGRSGRRSSSTTKRRCAARPGPTSRPPPARSSSTGRRRSRRSRCCALLAEEGLGADVSTVGELEFALRRRDRRRAPGRARQQQGGRAPPAAPPTPGALIVARLARRARPRAGARRRTLPVRVTPGIEADTHEAVKTAHHGSKFGLPPDDAVEALAADAGGEGLHVHVGSQLHALRRLADDGRLGRGLRRPAARGARAGRRGRSTSAAGWACGTCSTSRRSRSTSSWAGLVGELARAFQLQGLPAPALILEPGRSIVSRAGVTLYTVGVVKKRERGDDVRHGRRRHVGQPAPGDVQRALHRADRQPRRRAGGGRLRGRGQALRVGRRPDRARRAARAAPRRPARRSRHRGVHAGR